MTGLISKMGSKRFKSVGLGLGGPVPNSPPPAQLGHGLKDSQRERWNSYHKNDYNRWVVALLAPPFSYRAPSQTAPPRLMSIQNRGEI